VYGFQTDPDNHYYVSEQIDWQRMLLMLEDLPNRSHNAIRAMIAPYSVNHDPSSILSHSFKDDT
jgi:hypothetical protein